MKKLLILALITILLTLAGCTKNNTSSGGVSSADNTANSFIEENVSSEIETENSEDTDISEPKETTSEKNKTNDTNSNVSSESVGENNSSTTTPTTNKEENAGSTTNNTNSGENNNAASNTSTETSEPEVKTIKFYELTTYYGFTGYFSKIQGDYIVKELGIGSDNDNISRGITEYYDMDTNESIFFTISKESGFDTGDIAYASDSHSGRHTIPVKVIQ